MGLSCEFLKCGPHLCAHVYVQSHQLLIFHWIWLSFLLNI